MAGALGSWNVDPGVSPNEATPPGVTVVLTNRPPFDPELEAALTLIGDQVVPTVTPEMIPLMRGVPAPTEEFDAMLREEGMTRRDIRIPGFQGAEILLAVLQLESHVGLGPGILYIHGGGMIGGDRLTGAQQTVPWIREHDAVAVSVEYRLAPEFPDPAPVEDCYAALVWVADHAEELGIDRDRLLIAGASAGGGLAAGTALIARDRRGPQAIGQLLCCPMLDDRDRTTSTHQIDGVGVWDRGSNVTGWTALLGERKGTDEVSIYAAPARATDLSGLPPTYIDCGSAEVFRDEDVAYASTIWACGGRADLHVWAGGFHGFDGFAPHAAVSISSNEARNGWVARILNG
jgi:acetyl esterase/lipase